MTRASSYTITCLTVGQMQENCYLVVDKETSQAVVVDPGDDGQYILDKLHGLQAQPVMILATHGHFDHVMAAFEIQVSYNVPFLLHADDVFLLDRMRESAQYFLGVDVVDPPPTVSGHVQDKERITFGKTSLTVMHTPGHTPGSICIKLPDGAMLVGDTIFAEGGVGRTDFSYSDQLALMRSVRQILKSPGPTILYPGHGQETTIDAERAHHSV